MTKNDRQIAILAIWLLVLSGYVDAVGFIYLGGFFLFSIGADTTLLGLGLAKGSAQAGFAAALIGIFVLGVMAGSLVLHRARHHPRAAVLMLVCILLLIAAGLSQFGITRGPVGFMALAMGAANSVFEQDDEKYGGLMSFTAPLARLGEEFARIDEGSGRGWLYYLFMWLGFVLGALAGAGVYKMVAMGAVWIAVAAAALLAFAAMKIENAGDGSLSMRNKNSADGGERP